MNRSYVPSLIASGCCWAGLFLISLVGRPIMAEEKIEASHRVAFDLPASVEGQAKKLQMFRLGPRGYLWLHCVSPDPANDSDNGHLVVYDPNGLLFNTVPAPFAFDNFNFTTKTWLYLVSSDRIARSSLEGRIEADIDPAKLYGESNKPMPKERMRPAIAGLEDAIFVAYPDSDQGTYGIWRLSLDLSLEAKIISGLEGHRGRIEIQVDGENLLIADPRRGQVSIYNRNGKRIGGFGKKSSAEWNGFAGDYNPVGIFPLSTSHLLTGEIGSGMLKRFDHQGNLLGLVAKVELDEGCQSFSLAYDEKRDWYYAMHESQSKVLAILPSNEAP
jgi:hypothetical protein